MSSHDCLNKFLLQDRSARVIAVQMNEVWQVALANQPKNPAVRQLLGELMSAASLLSANLKFNGSLMLQLQGNGAIKLMVVECRQDLSMRATVKLNDMDIPDDANLQSLLNPDGQGRFSVILNPPRDTPGSQPYQGIVPLQADGVSQALEDYMRQSEQLETHLWLAASEERIAGVLLQRMPADGGRDQTSAHERDASFEHAKALCQTIETPELLAQTSETLMHRLFWQTPIVGLESLEITWRCGCDRTRVANMLRGLGQQEVDAILEERGNIEVTCEFCGTPYRFDAVDATALFTSASAPSSNQLQ
jgi:molecular chaperone Hsp33